MKAFLFSGYNLGDKVIFEMIKKSLSIPTEYIGQDVDLSQIKPVKENLIIIINHSLFKVDLELLIGYINKDLSTPLVVVKKTKTFGAIGFGEYRRVDKIWANKVFLFAGIIYLPKAYFRNRMSDIFTNLDRNKKKVRSYIL